MKKIILALTIGLAATCASAGDFRGHNQSTTSFSVSKTYTSYNSNQNVHVSVNVQNNDHNYRAHPPKRNAHWNARGKHRSYNKHHRPHWR